jgi:carbohydrate binding protein with CBM5/12 domain
MAYVFRTPGPWGPGKGSDLAPDEVDGNFWQAIQDIAAKAAQGVGIANIVVTGNQFTVVLTDHTLLGPYELPMMTIQFKGEWQPSTSYLAGDVITHGGSTYFVNVNHTSAATFDPGATDGLGHDLYGLLLQNPASTIPPGGFDKAFLRKVGTVDFVSAWETALLDDLADVSVASAIEGNVLVFSSGIWTAQAFSSLSFLLSQLGDVSIAESPGLVTGQLLTWNGFAWTNQLPAFNPNILSPLAGQILTYKTGEWENSMTADIPIKSGITVFGSLSLDYSQGAVQRVVMTNGVTLTGVTNWPPAGQFGRLMLEIKNNGAFTWTWPTGYHWPGGTEPTVSVSGRDLYALTTFDGGTNVDGSIIGQNYL